MNDSIDSIIKELENDYWYCVHNKLGKEPVTQAFYSLQYHLNQYHILGRPLPQNNYSKIHDHYFEKYLRGKHE